MQFFLNQYALTARLTESRFGCACSDHYCFRGRKRWNYSSLHFWKHSSPSQKSVRLEQMCVCDFTCLVSIQGVNMHQARPFHVFASQKRVQFSLMLLFLFRYSIVFVLRRCFFLHNFQFNFYASRKITRIIIMKKKETKKLHKLFACALRVAVLSLLLSFSLTHILFFVVFVQERMDLFASKFRNYSSMLLLTTSSTFSLHDIYVWHLIIVINSY